MAPEISSLQRLRIINTNLILGKMTVMIDAISEAVEMKITESNSEITGTITETSIDLTNDLITEKIQTKTRLTPLSKTMMTSVDLINRKNK